MRLPTRATQPFVCPPGRALETYEVVVSEYAVEEHAGVKMIGQTTGTNIWDTFSSEIPSNCAVYGKPYGGRALWEEVNDGKTHLYLSQQKEALAVQRWKQGKMDCFGCAGF